MAQQKKCDLNSCTVEELANLEGMNRKTAQVIIAQRDRVNGFDDWDDLRAIDGVGHNVLQKLLNNAIIGRRA